MDTINLTDGMVKDLAAQARDDVMAVLRRTAGATATPEQAVIVTMGAAGVAVAYLAGSIVRAYQGSEADAYALALEMCDPRKMQEWVDEIENERNVCPHSGGSGHRADIATASGGSAPSNREELIELRARALWLAGCEDPAATPWEWLLAHPQGAATMAAYRATALVTLEAEEAAGLAVVPVALRRPMAKAMDVAEAPMETCPLAFWRPTWDAALAANPFRKSPPIDMPKGAKS